MKHRICIDPGHGKSNRSPGKYDTGAEVRDGARTITEAGIVMDWANELKNQLVKAGHRVIRTRIDADDPAPVSKRALIAKSFACDVLISLHCNCANGRASGTETFYRGAANKPLAAACNEAVWRALGTPDRGLKTESQSQHARLAVLSFPRAVLIELGFIDHPTDRARMQDEKLMLLACQQLAGAIISQLDRAKAQ